MTDLPKGKTAGTCQQPTGVAQNVGRDPPDTIFRQLPQREPLGHAHRESYQNPYGPESGGQAPGLEDQASYQEAAADSQDQSGTVTECEPAGPGQKMD